MTNLSDLGVKGRLDRLVFEIFEESRSQARNLVVMSEEWNLAYENHRLLR